MNTGKYLDEHRVPRGLEPGGFTRVPLTMRQRRVWINAARPEGGRNSLTGAAVQMSSDRGVAECVAVLRQLCLGCDSLRAHISADAADLHWRVERPVETAEVLRVVAPGPAGLTAFLHSLIDGRERQGVFTPLTVTHAAAGTSRRTWFLAIGAARCDLSGLERLIDRWALALQGDSSRTRSPSLAAVERALARNAESAEVRSMRAYWARHLDGFGAGDSPGEVGPRAQPREGYAPRPIAIERGRALLAEASRRLGFAQRTVLLAAWLLVVGRLAAERSASVWLRLDGRPSPGQRDFIGHLAHYLPLSQRLEPDETCGALLRELERTLAFHDKRQDSYYGDSSLVGGQPAARELQFWFHEATEIALPAQLSERFEGGEPFRLRLCGESSGDGSDLTLCFDSNSIRPVQAEYLARHLAQVLCSLSDSQVSLAAVGTPPAGLYDAVLEAERGPLRPQWIDRDRLAELFVRGLRSCRVFATESPADSEPFAARVLRRVKSLLDRCGDGAQAAQGVIALVTPTSLQAAVTVVAALYAGIAIAFVDRRWPTLRRRGAIEQVGATLVISPDGAECPADIQCCSIEDLLAAEVAIEPHASGVDPTGNLDAIAYVIYTSGSTGAAKAVLVSRRALQSQLLWLAERLPLDASDTILHRTALGFDAAVWELLHAICAGARLAIPPEETSSDPPTIVREVVRHRISVLQLTPHLLRAVTHEPEFLQASALRLVVCGGDRLPRGLAEEVTARASLRVVNAYGPSECCIQVSMEDLCAAHLHAGMTSASVGTAMVNAGIHILNSDCAPVLDGLVGRLYISGAPLAHGYAGDPVATARAFVPLPGTLAAGLRMYDTGDLARRVGSCQIEIIGRVDKVVKLNGVRIDLLAIERCLQQLDGVEEAAVVVVSDEYGSGHLSAFLVVHTDADAVSQAARARVAEVFPPTSQPAHYLCVAQLPLTDRGKIDADALRESALRAAKHAHTPPRTPLERTIAEVWKTLLKREDLGIHDDFFLSGGHSLLFAQVIVRLRQALSLEISLRAIFMHPTIALLAQHIEDLQRGAALAARPPAGGGEQHGR